MNFPQPLESFLSLLEAKRSGSLSLAVYDIDRQSGKQSLYFRSPADAEKLSIWVWIDDNDEISITFGSWHTHESCAVAFTEDSPVEAILAIVCGILDGKFVLAIDGNGSFNGFTNAVWLNKPRTLDELFDKPWSPDVIHVQSWDGSTDKLISRDS